MGRNGSRNVLTTPERLFLWMSGVGLLLGFFGLYPRMLYVSSGLQSRYLVGFSVSAVHLALLFRILRDERYALGRSIRRTRHRGWGAILALVVLLPLLWGVAVAQGLPYLQHLVESRPGEAVVTIRKKAIHYPSRHCPGQLVVADGRYGNGRICGTPANMWETLEAGDRIRLAGTFSRFGIGYERMAVEND